MIIGCICMDSLMNLKVLFDCNNNKLDKGEIENSIITGQGQFGQICEIKLFEYKEFLNLENLNHQVAIPDDLSEIFDPAAVKRTKKSQNGEGNLSKLLKLDSSEFEDDLWEENGAEPIGYHNLRLDDKDLEAAMKKDKNDKIRRSKRQFKNSEGIINSLEKGRSKKLDKSYALIRFDTPESKTKVIRPDLRAFGITIANNQCKVEDAEFKLSQNVYNCL